MKEILERVLLEVDSDIREFMLAESKTGRNLTENVMRYANWELLPDPTMIALKWQELRDRHKT